MPVPGKSHVFSALVLLMLSGVAVRAAGPGGMSEEQMQSMMQNAQKMQDCFENIDRSAIDRLKQEGNRAEAEIRALCKAGKRDQAQARAVEYSRTMRDSEEFKSIRKCGMMAMENMPLMTEKSMEEGEHGHVCDRM